MIEHQNTGHFRSEDPDDPENKDFEYQWFCRVASREENYTVWDTEGFPVWSSGSAVPVPKEPQVPSPINPVGGCFGQGRAGPLKAGGSGLLVINTNRFVSGRNHICFLNAFYFTSTHITLSSLQVTYAQSYEFLVIVSKPDGRRAITTLEVDVGKIPAPVIEIGCKGASACTPRPGGVLVNPTKRLALESICQKECEGELSYLWSIQRVEEGAEPMQHVRQSTCFITTVLMHGLRVVSLLFRLAAMMAFP